MFLNLAHEMCEENRNAQTHFLGGQKLGHRRRFADPNTQQNIVIMFDHGGGWHSSPQFQRLSATKKLVFPRS